MNPPTAADSKERWRAWAKEVRSTLEIRDISERVTTQLTSWGLFGSARHILTYLAFGSEVDLARLSEQEKTLYVTRTWETGRNLTVHRLDGRLETHRYGYAQPTATSSVIDPQKIDLALVPGLCFDLLGTRLGYGLGYYDRLLPKLRPEVPLVGVTLEALVVPELPKDAFDIPMTHLLTEAGIKPL